jgi:hypothetical protein
MRSYLMTGAFWGGAAERCVKTIAQVVASMLVLNQFTTVLNVSWTEIAGSALTAGLLSLLTSIASGPAGPSGSPSLVNDRPAPVKDIAV